MWRRAVRREPVVLWTPRPVGEMCCLEPRLGVSPMSRSGSEWSWVGWYLPDVAVVEAGQRRCHPLRRIRH